MCFTKTQGPTLETRKQNNDLIVAQCTVQNTRLYTSFPTPDAYAEFILSKTEGSDTANEVLWTSCNTFLDIDCPMPLHELGFSGVPDFVKQFNEFLIANFTLLLGVDITEHQILWANSTRPSKTSFHIIIKSPFFFWKAEQLSTELKSFVKILSDKSLDIPGFHFLTEKKDEIQTFSILDTTIYHLNRCFRSLLCKKPKNDVYLQPMRHGVVIPGSHSLIVQYSVTENDKTNKVPFKLLVQRKPVIKHRLQRSLLDRLAAKYGSKIHAVQGSLIKLRNLDACRYCPISEEINVSDCAYFIRKNGALFFGCFNESCSGKLKQIYAFQSTFQTYNCYKKILKMPQAERTNALVQDFLRKTCCYIDIPGKGSFVTSRIVPCKGFQSLQSREIIEATQLFSGNSDVKFKSAADTELSISEVLKNLVQTRNLPIFSRVHWVPFLKTGKYQPSLQPDSFNSFGGFSLDSEDIKTDIDFTQTKIYELFGFLTDFQKESTTYLHDFIAHKLQKPFFKAPISLCFINTKQGCGKGTFAKFLELLFSCNATVMCSFNRMSQFTSVFNSLYEKALWVCLEEVTCESKNSLKQFSGLLKDITSQTSCTLEKKGQDKVVCDFRGNILIFSNQFNCISVSRDCRRNCVFETNNKKCNDKQFFDDIYQELSDLKTMRSAFKFYATRDIDNFDYRKYPKTKLLDRLKQCSDDLDMKFVQYLFTEHFIGQYSYKFSAVDIYELWQDFIRSRGLESKRDLNWCACCFENTIQIKKEGKMYCITQTEVTAILKEYF
jgi:hypothetical protein